MCISCDPATYSSQELDAAGTLSLALNNNPGAIVLFSSTSTHCAYTYDGDKFPLIYTMTTYNSSLDLFRNLEMGNSQRSAVVIKFATGDSNSPNGSSTTPTGGSYDGHSPTTAVAMIILYSITGIITALFLIIIVVGAVRAHRHPERYGPRNMLGRPRQSRARGIARAMLETIPIVKFGEREENKPAQPIAGGDVELGPTTRDAPTDLPPAVQVQRPSTEQVQPSEPTKKENEGSEEVTTEKAAVTRTLPEGEASTDANAESGLACSVCTDDFTKGQDVRVLPCNHKFHPECIDPWLLNVSGTCPLWYVLTPPTHLLLSFLLKYKLINPAAVSTSAPQPPTQPRPKPQPTKTTPSTARTLPTPQPTTSTTPPLPTAAAPAPVSRSTSNTPSTAAACATPRPKSGSLRYEDCAPRTKIAITALTTTTMTPAPTATVPVPVTG